MLQLLLYFGGTVSATIVVTTLVCRYQTTHKKKISYGTLILSPLVANVLVFVLLGGLILGWEFYSPSFWIGNWAIGATLGVVILITTLCILPALAVVVVYQKLQKKDGKRLD